MWSGVHGVPVAPACIAGELDPGSGSQRAMRIPAIRVELAVVPRRRFSDGAGTARLANPMRRRISWLGATMHAAGALVGRLIPGRA